MAIQSPSEFSPHFHKSEFLLSWKSAHVHPRSTLPLPKIVSFALYSSETDSSQPVANVMRLDPNTLRSFVDWPMHLQYPFFTALICDDINIAFFADTNSSPHWMNTGWLSAREGPQGKIVQTTISQPESIICSTSDKLGNEHWTTI